MIVHFTLTSGVAAKQWLRLRSAMGALMRALCRLAAVYIGLVPYELMGAVASECRPFTLYPAGREFIQIDNAWSGTRVPIQGLVKGSKVYIGYYDAERFLTVAEIDRAAGRVCRVRLPSQFDGWDNHNSVVLSFDAEGYLHVAGNMHGTALIYGRAGRADSLDGLKLRPMLGHDEAHVTYPTFLDDGSGRLLFLYRSGLGLGGPLPWLINRFDGVRWERLGDGPLFTDRFHGRSVFAYPSRFVRDERGVIHVAAVWRGSTDVATNFAVTYAKSRDLITWFDHSGRRIARPLSPDNMAMVELTGEKVGLLNSVQVFLTRHADRSLSIHGTATMAAMSSSRPDPAANAGPKQ